MTNGEKYEKEIVEIAKIQRKEYLRLFYKQNSFTVIWNEMR